jgi:hypothetical protein
MSQVLGTFGLLNFTMLWPVFAWRAFLNLRTVYFINFQIFSSHGKRWILNQQTQGHTCIARIKIVHIHKVYTLHLTQSLQKAGDFQKIIILIKVHH